MVRSPFSTLQKPTCQLENCFGTTDQRSLPEAVIILPNNQSESCEVVNLIYSACWIWRMSNADWESDPWLINPWSMRLFEPYPTDDCYAFDADEWTLEEADESCPSICWEGRHAPARKCHHEHGELGKHGLGRDITGRCLMPPLTFEDFWFRASVSFRVLLMDCSFKDPQSTRSFEHNKERMSLMLTSLDGRIGQVLVQDIFHHCHARELFDLFTMDFAGCRPVKLEDTYDWSSLGDRDIDVSFNFFCRHDGRSACARTSPTYRGRSKSYTGSKVELESMEQEKTAKLQDRKPRSKSQPKQADQKIASSSVSSYDAKASDDGLARRIQRLPQELHDEIKETLFDVTLGPHQTNLETGKLYPNVLRAFNREFYHQKRGTWLSSKLWTTFPHYPMRNPRDDWGRLTPISIPSQLRTQVKQLSVTFDWSGLCQGCLTWLDNHYFKHESYPKHWLPHENKDVPLKHMFDIAIDYLDHVKVANAEILEAWVHELSVIHDLALDLLILDTRSAYNYSGEFIGLDVVKECFRVCSHNIQTVVVKAPNNDLKEEIFETFEDNRSASN